jgi:transposase
MCVSPKSNRKEPADDNKETYNNRHHVENFFQSAKSCRRIGTRYEKTEKMFMAFIHLFASMDYTLHSI